MAFFEIEPSVFIELAQCNRIDVKGSNVTFQLANGRVSSHMVAPETLAALQKKLREQVDVYEFVSRTQDLIEKAFEQVFPNSPLQFDDTDDLPASPNQLNSFLSASVLSDNQPAPPTKTKKTKTPPQA